jgi:serine/threonine-protein kinase
VDADSSELSKQAEQIDQSLLGVTARLSTRTCPQCGLAVSVTQSACPVDGTQLDVQFVSGALLGGKYEFIQLTGRGGMGVIYKARHIVLNKIVAIKMLHSDLINERTLKRFKREARAASALSHPNIVAVNDFAVSEHGQPYLVMDYIEGATLEDKIRTEGLLDVSFTVEAILQICAGLSHAHKMGVLHRDIKPSNITIVEGPDGNFLLRILDFGIAQIIGGIEDGTMALTQTGDSVGSPLYMSPEQCAGKQVDTRSELWAVGCTMFECLTGLPPFIANGLANLIAKISNEECPSLKEASFGKDFPPALEAIVQKLLRKNPEERYQTVEELASDLRDFQAGKRRILVSNEEQILETKKQPDKFAVVVAGSSILAALIAVGLWVQSFTKSFPNVVSAVLPTKLQPLHNTASSISSSHADLKSALVKWVNDHPNATNINLGYWEISDPDLAPLVAETQCVSLNLPGNSIRGQGLKYLASMNQLVSLRLDKNEIYDPALSYLSRLSSLHKINLSNTNIQGSGLSYLSGLKLVSLDLSNTKISRAYLSSIAKLTALEELKVAGTAFDDQCIDLLTPLRKLKILDLNHTQISDAGVGRLVRCEELEEVSLSGDAVDDTSISYLGRLQKLAKLDISGTAISASGVKKLGLLKNLKVIYCLACSQDLMSAFAQLKRQLPECQVFFAKHR